MTLDRPRLVRTGDTVDHVVRSLADLIVTGALAPGTRLDETALAERFEVSRTPVREALGRLGAMGLVERRPNRGALVIEPSPERLAAMFEVMAELEGVCARLAAERMSTTERRDLDDGHHASRALVHAGNEDGYEQHNTGFHASIYAGGHNAHLEELALSTRARLAPFRRAQFRLPGRLAKSYDEHDGVVTAILRGDGRAAELAMRAHVAQVGGASSELLYGAQFGKLPAP